MIHHLSMSARDPKKVADVFAELMDGVSTPFPPCPGAYIALARDGHGTAVEVYPAGVVLEADGERGASFVVTDMPARSEPVHLALSVDSTVADVEAIARREGWRCFVCSRGGYFDVVEVWIENRFLLEVLPPDFGARYLDFADGAAFDAPPGLAAPPVPV